MHTLVKVREVLTCIVLVLTAVVLAGLLLMFGAVASAVSHVDDPAPAPVYEEPLYQEPVE